MAIFYVDVSAAADPDIIRWDQLTELDGREYVLQFTWNDRYQSWYLDVFDQDSSPIFYGRRLGIGVKLGREIVGDSRMWPGILTCVTQSQDLSDPGRDDLGTRVLLVYDDLQRIVE